MNFTTCPLCGEVIKEGQEYTGFPPLTGNELDELHIFSDAGVHLSCLRQHPSCEKAEKYRELATENNHRCNICGEIIERPDEYVGFGILTSDPGELLHDFNFFRLHRKHLPDWPDRQRFLALAATFLQQGKWSGYPVLQMLMAELS